MGLIYIEHILVQTNCLLSVCLSVVYSQADSQTKTIGPNSTKLWSTVFVCQTYQLKITAESAHFKTAEVDI